MKPLAMVEVNEPGLSFRVLLLPGGWQVVGQPDSRIALILDKLTRHGYGPADGDPIPQIARHAAEILGGTYKVYAKFEPKPGVIY